MNYFRISFLVVNAIRNGFIVLKTMKSIYLETVSMRTVTQEMNALTIAVLLLVKKILTQDT